MNTHLNLSAIRDPEGVKIKHIMDSMELTKFFPLENNTTVCDIGTGGGFPLLPLAIYYPLVHFTWIDSTRKKVDAVNAMIQKLEIKNAKAIRARSEDYKEEFDVVTARAVGYIDKVLEWSYHLLKKGGHFVFYKQVSPEEKTDLLEMCKIGKLKLVHEHIYSLPPGDIERVIYVLKKN